MEQKLNKKTKLKHLKDYEIRNLSDEIKVVKKEILKR